MIHGKSSVTLKELSDWNFDGSSTDQAPGKDSEVIIKPRAVFRDPFRRGGNHVLVVTDTYAPKDGKLVPIPSNSRHLAAEVFNSATKEEPWFGIEQEYTLFQDGRPLGWPKSAARSNGDPTATYGYPAPQGPYYCAAGADRVFGRDLVEAHLEHCLYAGLTVSGINAEVMPGQWEFQIGPCTGIDSGDHMLASRYILNRVAESFEVGVSYEPKPISGDWNGAGCHTNFSTKNMREVKNSFKDVIIPAIEKLGERHQQHINVYGENNDQRLTGRHETAGIEKFSYGVANRGASVRIPNSTAREGLGYFEDRRPASNMDPYVVTSMIFDSAILGGSFANRFDEIKTDGVDIVEELKPVAGVTQPAEEIVSQEVKALNQAEKTADAPSRPKSYLRVRRSVRDLKRPKKTSSVNAKPKIPQTGRQKSRNGCVLT